jgi:hypothetical protein
VSQVAEGVGNEKMPAEEEGRSQQNKDSKKTCGLLRHAAYPLHGEFEDLFGRFRG